MKIGAELCCLDIRFLVSAIKTDEEVNNANWGVWHWCQMFHVWDPGDPGFSPFSAPQLMFFFNLPANLQVDAGYRLY